MALEHVLGINHVDQFSMFSCLFSMFSHFLQGNQEVSKEATRSEFVLFEAVSECSRHAAYKATWLLIFLNVGDSCTCTDYLKL